jgi:hypothetical protein
MPIAARNSGRVLELESPPVGGRPAGVGVAVAGTAVAAAVVAAGVVGTGVGLGVGGTGVAVVMVMVPFVPVQVIGTVSTSVHAAVSTFSVSVVTPSVAPAKYVIVPEFPLNPAPVAAPPKRTVSAANAALQTCVPIALTVQPVADTRPSSTMSTE